MLSVPQSAEEMLRRAVRLLRELLKGVAATGAQVTLPARLVVRGSTAPPA